MQQFTQGKRRLQAVCQLVWDLCNSFLLKRNKRHTYFRAHRDFIEKAHTYFPQRNDFLALPGNSFLQRNYVLLLPATTGNSATARPAFTTDLLSIVLPFKMGPLGFPGGTVVESLPASAGDTGSSPGLGGSHMPRSNWAREPQLLSLSVWSLCSATREATIVRGLRTTMKSDPRLPQLEKALAQKRRPNAAKNK